MPPTIGPSIRLALLAPTSSDIAAPIRSWPTTSPIIVRRTGLSVVQVMPLIKLASARCQTSSAPDQASNARTTELSSIVRTTRTSAVRRSTRSAAAPISAPNRAIGSMRSMVNNATIKGDPVC